MLIYLVIYFVINSCANTPSAQYICKNTKNIQKSDFMDGFCWQGKLDLTLFYEIEGYFDNLKSLMTLMTGEHQFLNVCLWYKYFTFAK